MDSFDVIPGDDQDSLLDRSLVYQLLLVQLVFANKGSVDQLSETLNSHPLSAGGNHISQNEAEELYEAITNRYKSEVSVAIQSENAVLKARLLAEILYKKYKACLSAEIAQDEAEFSEAYQHLIDS